MGLSALSLVQSFCYETNIPAPTTLVSAPDPNVLQQVNLLYAVCRKLREAKCWPQMKKTATITTSNGVTSYALPADFYAPMCDTFWDQTNHWKINGPQTDSRYNELFYGYIVNSGVSSFRMFGLPSTTQFNVYPPPGTTNITFSFDYIQANYFLAGGSGTTWQTTVTSNNDTCLFDDDLIITGLKWFWDLSKGLDFSSWQAMFEHKVNYAQARWDGSKKTSLYARPQLVPGLDPNIPYGSFGTSS